MQRLMDPTQQEDQGTITGTSPKYHTGDRNQLRQDQVEPLYTGFFHVQAFTPRFVQNQQGGEPKLGRADGRATRAPSFLLQTTRKMINPTGTSCLEA